MHKTVRLSPADGKSALEEVSKLASELLDSGRSIAVTVADEDEVLSPAEAASRLGFSRQHVMRLVAAEELDAEQMAGSSYWKIPLASVLAFEERREAAHKHADEFSRELDQLGAPLE